MKWKIRHPILPCSVTLFKALIGNSKHKTLKNYLHFYVTSEQISTKKQKTPYKKFYQMNPNLQGPIIGSYT
jgi:hypothetical protein